MPARESWRTAEFPILSVFSILLLLFHRLRALQVGIVPYTRNTYKVWTFTFVHSADPLWSLQWIGATVALIPTLFSDTALPITILLCTVGIAEQPFPDGTENVFHILSRRFLPCHFLPHGFDGIPTTGSPALDSTKPGGERNTRKRAGNLNQNGYGKML